MILGVILWNKLPDPMPIHWNAMGEVDGWTSKAFAVFGMPAILAALNLVCHIATGSDKKNKNQSKKVVSIIFWLVPIIANLTCTMVYLTAMNIEVNALNIVAALLGIVFAIIGNYMPKCKLNYTIGIKIVWTLESEVNWLATHRVAGRAWLGGGIIIALSALLPTNVIVWVVLPVLVLIFTLSAVALSQCTSPVLVFMSITSKPKSLVSVIFPVSSFILSDEYSLSGR
jgi:uncharacterized membrane protein